MAAARLDPQDEFWCRVEDKNEKLVCRNCGCEATKFPHPETCEYATWFNIRLKWNDRRLR